MMLESMFNPKRLEKGPWKMFFIGILYASLSLILVKLFFSKDVVLAEYSGMIVITFAVMLILPFMYFIIREEEYEDEEVFGFFSVWRIHKDAIYSFLWLFLGFLLAFSFWYIILQDVNLFNAQIETFCRINSPGDINSCVEGYDFTKGTGATVKEIRLLAIIENNVYVVLFTLILSLIFGAGAIFVLAWNASVIATAISIFAQNKISEIPFGILRYMVHGFPEIAAYFIAALAGGILSVAVVNQGVRNLKFYRVLRDVSILIAIAVILLVIGTLVEVFITPLFF